MLLTWDRLCTILHFWWNLQLVFRYLWLSMIIWYHYLWIVIYDYLWIVFWKSWIRLRLKQIILLQDSTYPYSETGITPRRRQNNRLQAKQEVGKKSWAKAAIPSISHYVLNSQETCIILKVLKQSLSNQYQSISTWNMTKGFAIDLGFLEMDSRFLGDLVVPLLVW